MCDPILAAFENATPSPFLSFPISSLFPVAILVWFRVAIGGCHLPSDCVSSLEAELGEQPHLASSIRSTRILFAPLCPPSPAFLRSHVALCLQARSDDGGVHMALVLEQRYTRPPHLPTLNKWQHRQCAECGVTQSTGSVFSWTLPCSSALFL